MFGLCLVLFLAGIQKIPISLYEAARVDGAGRVREFFAVTLPGLRGELAVALTLTTIMALRTFDLIYVSTAGGPGTSTTVPSVLVYQNAFANGRVGLAAAVAVVLTAADLRRRVRDHAHRRPGPEPMTAARREQLLSYAVLVVFAIIAIYPIVSIVLLALHKRSDLVTGFSIPDSLDFGTFKTAWEEGGFGRGLINSFIVAATVTVVSAVLSTLAGLRVRRDALPRLRRCSSTCCCIGLIFPYEATVIPLYYVFRDAGLTDSLWALILPQIGLSVPFGTFWMRAFFRSTPGSLVEASRLDGASSFVTLWRVLLPQAWPAITTMIVLVFMWTWNEFLLALVMIQSDDLRTAPLGLALFAGREPRLAATRRSTAAAAVLVALPVVIVYVFLQRSFIRGMFAGAVKE